MENPWKTMIWSFVFAVIIEYGVCLAAANFLWGDDPHPYKNALWLMLALWALQFALGIKNLIVSTIHYYLFVRKSMTDLFAQKFMEVDMPYYDTDFMNGPEFLRAVLNDENSTREQIIVAAEFAGCIETIKGIGMIRGFRATKTLDLGFRKYVKTREAMERSRERGGRAFAETEDRRG